MDFNVTTQEANGQSPFSVKNDRVDNNFIAKKSSKKICLAHIRVHEIFSMELWRAAFTELVATSFLLFTLTISIISCLESHESEPKILVPFAVFIVAFFFLLTTIPLSGGHMNPIFTTIAMLKGIITLPRAIIYILAQCAGAIISYMMIKSVMNKSIADKYALGGCMIHDKNGGVSLETALVLEFCCTFLVLFVGVTVAFDKRRFKELGLVWICVILAAAMGLAVFLSITVTGKAGYGGVGLNPARCLGAAVLHGGELWYGHWVFWVGPFFACIVYYGYTWTLPKETMM